MYFHFFINMNSLIFYLQKARFLKTIKIYNIALCSHTFVNISLFNLFDCWGLTLL